jgi:hypothetical protein
MRKSFPRMSASRQHPIWKAASYSVQAQATLNFVGLFVAARHERLLCRSQYFVFSLISSGGHSPWSYPMKVYSLKRNQIANFSDMIGGNPTVSDQFRFSGPHTVVASTWKQPGSTDIAVPVTIDLEAAFQKLPPTN